MILNDFWKGVVPYLSPKDKLSFNLTCREFYRCNHTKVTIKQAISPCLKPYLSLVKETIFYGFTLANLKPIASTVTHIVIIFTEDLTDFPAALALIPQLLELTFIGKTHLLEPHLPLLAQSCPELRALHLHPVFGQAVNSLPIFPKLQDLTIPIDSIKAFTSLSKQPSLINKNVILLDVKLIHSIDISCTPLILQDKIYDIWLLADEELVKLNNVKTIFYYKSNVYKKYIIHGFDLSTRPKFLERFLDLNFFIEPIYSCTHYFQFTSDPIFKKFLNKSLPYFLQGNIKLNGKQLGFFYECLKEKGFLSHKEYVYALIKLVISNNQPIFDKFLMDETIVATLKKPLEPGETIFHIIAKECRKSDQDLKPFIDLLIRKGFDPNTENIFGLNPFEVALQNHNKGAAAVFANLCSLRFKAWECALSSNMDWSFITEFSLPEACTEKNFLHVLIYHHFDENIILPLFRNKLIRPLFFVPDAQGFTPFALAKARFSPISLPALLYAANP